MSPDQIPYFENFINKDKIKLIHHGINTDFFRPSEADKNSDKFRCITVGHWQRDFDIISSVAGSLRDNKQIEFIFVTSRKAFPDKTGLEELPNVKLYRDNISDSDLLKLYQSSDLLFLPLVASTANNALLEGIACGLPVLSTLLESVKSYLPGDEAILIKEKDPAKYTDIILSLLENPERVKIMSEMARKRAEQLDWKIISNSYIELYSDLAITN